MKTIKATIPCEQQLLTSPAWGRIFEGLKRRYLRDLWLHTPVHLEEGRDEIGGRWLRQSITYTVLREDATMHFTITGPWCCMEPDRTIGGWPAKVRTASIYGTTA